MSEYFVIGPSTDRKEMGIFLQTLGVPNHLDFGMFDSPRSMTKLNNKEFPKENPELLWELEPKAKLTDVINPSNIEARGLLCNDKVVEILKQFELGEHRFYPATIIYKNENLNYYRFHPLYQPLDIIDFKNSEFVIFSYINNYTKPVQISSLEEFFLIRNNLNEDDYLGLLSIKPMINVDLFCLPLGIHSRLLVSKDMKEELLHNNITGINITPKLHR